MNPHHPKKGAAGWGENRGERIAAGDEAHQEDPSLVSDAVAKHMLVLVELLTPRIIAGTLEALTQRGMLSPPQQFPTARGSAKEHEKILKTRPEQAESIGVSKVHITAMRNAGKALGDPLPLRVFRSDLLAWRRRHPDFVASRWVRESKPLA